MNQQKAITMFGAVVICAAISSAAVAAGGATGWSYDGNTGPDSWGELSNDYAVCASGKRQSPIDLTDATLADPADVSYRWNPTAPWDIVNNGHTIQVNSKFGGSINISGKSFRLIQFHFHAPSEHAINGERTAMEAHMVHVAKDGSLAVVGVLIQGGGQNDGFSQLISAAPDKKGSEKFGEFDPIDLMPESDEFLRYNGSLTTPPCSEVVIWTVMRQPISVSDEAIAAFKRMYDGNARPLQDINRRLILAEN